MAETWLSKLRVFFDTRANNPHMGNDDLAFNGYKAPDESSYWTELVRDRLLSDVITKLKLSKEHHVLDVGCGTGMISRKIAAHVSYLTAIDFSAGMLAIARRHPMPNVTLLQANAAKLPLKEKVFDRVLCYFVIANFLDDDFTRSVLTQLIRATRKGGFVLIGNTPDNEKKDEQTKLLQEQCKSKTRFSYYQFLWNRMITRFGNIWSYRILRRSVHPSLGYRFYTRDFFKQVARQASCEIEFLPLDVEGFIYAPYRFDVRLWPV
jgi:ubiquinone/menaquinone biosynthesis C-methylase UbiE